MKNTSPKSHQQHLDELMTLSRDIVSEKYLEDILQLVITVAASVADIDICFLWLVDKSEHPKKIRLKAFHGIPLEDTEKQVFTKNEGMVDFIMRQERPMVIDDVPAVASSEEKHIIKKYGFHCLLGLPLKAPGDIPIGAITCLKIQPRNFSTEEIKRMSAVADKAAITIINTGLMVETRVAQEELETLQLLVKAREVLMRRQKIGKDEALGIIRHYSTESLKSPRRVAETILLSDAMDAPLN